MTETVFIYFLGCPITGLPRYVGKTKLPRKRLSCHLSNAFRENNRRTRWIRLLLRRGKKPVFKILDEVPKEVGAQWEVAWIEFFRNEGFDLVNETAGGEGMLAPSAETRKKLSRARIGNTNHTGKLASDATKANMSESQKRRRQREALILL